MILIKGMEMPTNGYDCPFCRNGMCQVSDDNSDGICLIYGPGEEHRPSDCPLIEVPEWISVAERLPDFEGMCLCMRKSYSKANFRHQEIMYFDYDEQAFCSNADGVFVADGNVTHWMPLPKPPEDGET